MIIRCLKNKKPIGARLINKSLLSNINIFSVMVDYKKPEDEIGTDKLSDDETKPTTKKKGKFEKLREAVDPEIYKKWDE